MRRCYAPAEALGAEDMHKARDAPPKHAFRPPLSNCKVCPPVAGQVRRHPPRAGLPVAARPHREGDTVAPPPGAVILIDEGGGGDCWSMMGKACLLPSLFSPSSGRREDGHHTHRVARHGACSRRLRARLRSARVVLLCSEEAGCAWGGRRHFGGTRVSATLRLPRPDCHACLQRTPTPASVPACLQVGKLSRDQVEAYAGRKGVPVPEAEKWLSPSLAYERA